MTTADDELAPHLLPLVQPKRDGQVSAYNSDNGLKTVAVGEAAEAHYQQVLKNNPDDPLAREQLRKAVATKIWAQAEYVTWRDSVVVPSRQKGKQKKPDYGIESERSHNLPPADPGNDTAYLWRKRFTMLDAQKRRCPDEVKIEAEIEKSAKRVTATVENERAAIKAEREETQAQKRANRASREKELAGKIAELPNKRYAVIVADPEWRFEPWSRQTGMDRAADNHYPTSVLEVIKTRDVPSISADDCVLFLWATIPMLPHTLAVMDAWGFEYKSHYCWGKDKEGTGYWSREKHELLLIGTRGNIPCPAQGEQCASLIMAPRAGHSEKPETFLQMIENYFPNLPKIELNCRGAPRPGWDAWGFEAQQPEAAE